MRSKKEHTTYCGIYAKICHPREVGEVFLFPMMAILLHLPFLNLFSLVYFLIFVILCYAEEQVLQLRYGKAYAAYCNHTGTFWPKQCH